MYSPVAATIYHFCRSLSHVRLMSLEAHTKLLHKRRILRHLSSIYHHQLLAWLQCFIFSGSWWHLKYVGYKWLCLLSYCVLIRQLSPPLPSCVHFNYCCSPILSASAYSPWSRLVHVSCWSQMRPPQPCSCCSPIASASAAALWSLPLHTFHGCACTAFSLVLPQNNPLRLHKDRHTKWPEW